MMFHTAPNESKNERKKINSILLSRMRKFRRKILSALTSCDEKDLGKMSDGLAERQAALFAMLNELNIVHKTVEHKPCLTADDVERYGPLSPPTLAVHKILFTAEREAGCLSKPCQDIHPGMHAPRREPPVRLGGLERFSCFCVCRLPCVASQPRASSFTACCMRSP